MSKSKNKGKDKEGAVSAESGSSAPKAPRKARSPMGPLPVRLCTKAEKVFALVTEMAKDLASRGGPQQACDAASAFAVQAESWRKVFLDLKDSGWEPVAAGVKQPIVEGDPIKILDEHLGRYQLFIEGLLDGTTQLVAGAVEQVNRMLVQVMLKDTNGKFYGYAPRQFLTRR
jgi:hypothetical protein